ncbi:hypothetical protein [Salinisphaera sp.]|nr:hypothetical protein [Salinisphaera sp.]
MNTPTAGHDVVIGHALLTCNAHEFYELLFDTTGAVEAHVVQ